MNNVLRLVENKKICFQCKEGKLIDGFSRSSRSSDGFKGVCKDCINSAATMPKSERLDRRKIVTLIEGGRVCRICNVGKSWSEFSKDAHGYNQKTSSCIQCRNEKGRQIYKQNPNVRRSGIKNRPDKLKRIYGITYQDVLDAYEAQNGLCANIGCQHQISLEVKGVTKDRAVIDHDHKTGKFRELLCAPCNSILGTLETKEQIVLGLMEYKQKHTKEL